MYDLLLSTAPFFPPDLDDKLDTHKSPGNEKGVYWSLGTIQWLIEDQQFVAIYTCFNRAW